MSQIDLLTGAVRALESVGVRYLLSGSLASSLQGEPRATHDIDLVVEVDARLIDALAEAFGTDRYFFDPRAARDALGRRAMFNLLDTTAGDKIDFWMLTDDPFDASRFARRVSVEAFGLNLWVSSPEDTILQKLRWAAASGGSERQMRDAVGVYEVQGGVLDEEYLDSWAERLGLSGLLAEARAAASSGA
ncbi:MAG: hypothetical protein U1E08_09340 [Coriobacteriia bacterium]|nr:hypothetical protein [Coriobacteriia bacterium]